jgi:hypothetical protein
MAPTLCPFYIIGHAEVKEIPPFFAFCCVSPAMALLGGLMRVQAVLAANKTDCPLTDMRKCGMVVLGVVLG